MSENFEYLHVLLILYFACRSTNDEKRKKKNPAKTKNVVKDMEEECKKVVKPGKSRPKLKGDSTLESGQDTDADQQYSGVSASREEKIKSLKADSWYKVFLGSFYEDIVEGHLSCMSPHAVSHFLDEQ
eukprot:Gb_38526 [translate_table: standard]